MKTSKAESLSMRAPEMRPRSGSSAATSARKPSGQRTFRTQVAVGDVICFDPTGEQLRVTRIEGGRITFEKQP